VMSTAAARTFIVRSCTPQAVVELRGVRGSAFRVNAGLLTPSVLTATRQARATAGPGWSPAIPVATGARGVSGEVRRPRCAVAWERQAPAWQA
jgi:hypothetical protein